jgi:hypothetical protein
MPTVNRELQPGRNGPAAAAPSPEPANAGTPLDLVSEAEAVRALLAEAQARVGRLLAALKQQRKQSRAVRAAVASLRQLQDLGP